MFHRSTRSITVTAEGALFLERSRRILTEIEAAQQELSRSTEAPRGRLRVSLPLVSSLVLPVLADFMRQYPEIELDLDFTDRMVDVIEAGFDAVVRTGELSDSRLSARQLAPDTAPAGDVETDSPPLTTPAVETRARTTAAGPRSVGRS